MKHKLAIKGRLNYLITKKTVKRVQYFLQFIITFIFEYRLNEKYTFDGKVEFYYHHCRMILVHIRSSF